ncbi:hypothetical protein D9M68_584870 [compost metagenome]
MVGQFAQRGGRTARGQVGGAGDEAVGARAEQLAGDVPRVGQRAAAEGDVDLLGDQVGLGVTEHELDSHQGVRGQEVGHPGHGEEVEEIGRGRHAHPAAGFLAASDERLPGLDQPVDRFGALFVKGLPGAGERELAGRSLQQPGAELRLQLLDAPAHGVGRQAQPPAGLGKAAVAHHLHEDGDVVEVEHGEVDSFCSWTSAIRLYRLVDQCVRA